MDLGLTGKAAWVSGGSGGIGFAIASALAAEGADIALTGRTLSTLEERAEAIRGASGSRALAIGADVSDRDAVAAAADSIAAQLGGIDILVNCAAAPGGKATGQLAAISDDDVLADLNEKFLGCLRTSQAAVPHMKRRGSGRLIHISGVNARRSGAYSGGPRNIAIVQLSKTLADELGADGITSNVVHPGATRGTWWSDQVAADAAARGIAEAEVEAEAAADYSIGRLLEPAEIAQVVAFLASPLSLPISGESIAVCGGARGAITI